MKKYIKDFKIYLLRNLKWIILFICIVLFLMILEDVVDKDIMTTDARGYTIVSTYLISDFTTPIAKTITNIYFKDLFNCEYKDICNLEKGRIVPEYDNELIK